MQHHKPEFEFTTPILEVYSQSGDPTIVLYQERLQSTAVLSIFFVLFVFAFGFLAGRKT